MGLFDFLSGGLTAGTNAASAYEGAQAQNAQRGQQNQMSLYSLLQQKQAADMQRQVQSSQIAENQSLAAQHAQDVSDRQLKALSNKRAYGTGHTAYGTNPLFASPFDEGSDYVSELKNAQTQGLAAGKEKREQQAAYNTFKLEFPNDPLAKQPVDPTNPADYKAALANARDLRKVQASQSQQNWVANGLDPASGLPILLNTKTGETKLGGGHKEFAQGGGTGSGAQAPVEDMKAQLKTIQGYADDLGKGAWNLTSGMQMKEGLDYGTSIDNAGGHPGITKPLGSAAISLFGQNGSPEDYQKYQNLMFATRAIGDDAAKVFKGRQNEQAVLREVALAQLGPDDYKNPMTVKAKLDRLQHVINLADQIMPDGARRLPGASTNAPIDTMRTPIPQRITTPVPASRAPTTTKQGITKDQADFLKTVKGMSDADIAARYRVTP